MTTSGTHTKRFLSVMCAYHIGFHQILLSDFAFRCGMEGGIQQRGYRGVLVLDGRAELLFPGAQSAPAGGTSRDGNDHEGERDKKPIRAMSLCLCLRYLSECGAVIDMRDDGMPDIVPLDLSAVGCPSYMYFSTMWSGCFGHRVSVRSPPDVLYPIQN